MRRVKGRDTRPELAFRRAVRKLGVTFRTCDPSLPGKPDLVFPARKLAVFIDGDFWHGHQWKRRKLVSLESQFRHSKNRSYWERKIRRNILRDLASTAALLDNGWSVIRFWESDLVESLAECVTMVLATLTGRGRKPRNWVPDAAHLTAVEFFAGIGLVRLALERQGWRVVFANDIDPAKQAMYQANFGGQHFKLGDIHDLTPEDIPSSALWTASFPCNDLSIAGAMEGLNGKQSGAFWGLVNILKQMGNRRPPLILLENVVGFLMSHKGSDFEQALMALTDLGYACDTFMLNAADFVPQSRARLFVVGKQAPSSQTLNSMGTLSKVRPEPLVRFINLTPQILWDVRPLPPPPKRKVKLAEIIEDLPDGDPQWWSKERAEYFMGQLSQKHFILAKLMIGQKRYSYATAFRRVRRGRSMAELRTDGIAGCLRTPRGGSGRQILFKGGRGEYKVRLLTPRECARLQGVPDSYRIDVPLNKALFGFGDAVCVPVIEWIAKHYLTPVASELIRDRLLVPPLFDRGR